MIVPFPETWTEFGNFFHSFYLQRVFEFEVEKNECFNFSTSKMMCEKMIPDFSFLLNPKKHLKSTDH